MLRGTILSASAIVGTAVFRIVVSSDSMKKATATSHGRSRLRDSLDRDSVMRRANEKLWRVLWQSGDEDPRFPRGNAHGRRPCLLPEKRLRHTPGLEETPERLST